MTSTELMQRQSHLLVSVQRQLPDFAKACASDVEIVILHQDSFAAAYEDSEYTLLGMAIKYAGLCGKAVQIIGRNDESVSRAAKPQ